MLIIFLALVLGMTFKGYKYGNGTTIDEYDPGKWQYGQNVCILVVTVAVLAEFLIFLASIFLMIRGIILMLIDSLTTPKTSSDVSADKLKKTFVRYKNGVFFCFFDKEAQPTVSVDQTVKGKSEKKAKEKSWGPDMPKKLSKDSKLEKKSQKKRTETGNRTEEKEHPQSKNKLVKPHKEIDITVKK